MSRARSHGVATPLEYVKALTTFTVDVSKITCPTFLSYGEGDPAQADTAEFYKRLQVDEKRFTMYRDAMAAAATARAWDRRGITTTSSVGWRTYCADDP